MAYPYQQQSGFPGYPAYPTGDPSYAPGGQQGFPGGPYPPVGGGAYPPAAGGYPQAGGYPAPGGFPGAMPSYPQAPGYGAPSQGGGYGAPPGAPGYGPPGGVPGYGGAGFGAPPGGFGAPAGGPYGGGGYNVPPGGAGGFGAPQGGAPGYGGFQQPTSQSYGGGAPGQAPGGYPSGPAPGQQPSFNLQFEACSTPPYQAAMTATQGTIRPAANFDALADAEKLRKAMKGFGTDEAAIIDVVSNRSNDQRQKIKAAFKTAYGKDLIKDMKSELSGNVEELILALFMNPTYYDAWSLHNAMKGAGTTEKVLIEILCSRSNAEIRNIVACYKSEFGRDIEKDIRSDTSGHFERLLVSMCQGNRDESTTVNVQQAEQDAQRLYQAGEGKLGTDESSFNMVLACRSFPQLRAVAEAYARISKRDLFSVIGREFSGHIEDGLKAILQCALNRPAYFAERLCKAMKGAGTDDSTLIRIVVTRSEIDLAQIKQAFAQMYQKSLAHMIQGDTSGDYRRLLVAITGQ